jgi:uncharacterized protein YqjF (DUF2071 family)
MPGERPVFASRHADALFVHYAVDAHALQALLPKALRVDTHDGVAYVGVVCLTEAGVCSGNRTRDLSTRRYAALLTSRVRPSARAGIVPLPPGVPRWLVRWMGLSHHAVNVRTYVRPVDGGPPGIFFFSLDCSALLPTLGARALFNLPCACGRDSMCSVRTARRREVCGSNESYASRRACADRYARMGRCGARVLGLESKRVGSDASVVAQWVAEEEDHDALGRFLVERYALYNAPGRLLRTLVVRSGASVWCGTITHAPWPLRRARLVQWQSSVLEAAGLASLVRRSGPDHACVPAVVHASSGVGPIEFFWRGSAPSPS